MKIRIAVAALLYLGIGALFHAVIAGETLAWDSAWTWGLLIGWPLVVVAIGGTIAIIVTLIVLVLVAMDVA